MGLQFVEIGVLLLAGFDIRIQTVRGLVVVADGCEIHYAKHAHNNRYGCDDGYGDANGQRCTRCNGCAHSSLLDCVIHAPASNVSSSATAMANGQTMATVLVRCLDVCVTRHLLDASLESPPLMVVVALS